MHEVELDRRDDARHPLAAAKGEEQLGVLRRGGPPQDAVAGDDLDGAHLVDGEPVGPRHRPETAAGGVADDADVGDRAGQRRQTVRRCGLDDLQPLHAGPDAGPALGVDDDLVEAAVVTSSSVTSSAIGPWPVACGVTRRPLRAPKCTASTTSCAVSAATTTAGLTGIARFHGETSASYSWSPGTATVPVVRASRSAKALETFERVAVFGDGHDSSGSSVWCWSTTVDPGS